MFLALSFLHSWSVLIEHTVYENVRSPQVLPFFVVCFASARQWPRTAGLSSVCIMPFSSMVLTFGLQIVAQAKLNSMWDNEIRLSSAIWLSYTLLYLSLIISMKFLWILLRSCCCLYWVLMKGPTMCRNTKRGLNTSRVRTYCRLCYAINWLE